MSRRFDEASEFLEGIELSEGQQEQQTAIEEEVWQVISYGIGQPDAEGHILTQQEAEVRYHAWHEAYRG